MDGETIQGDPGAGTRLQRMEEAGRQLSMSATQRILPVLRAKKNRKEEFRNATKTHIFKEGLLSYTASPFQRTRP